ncbi:hypothetical protein COLO4_14203 [Corchorus olitorius]|uniref:DEAD-box ATP-dependent RNA helicase 7 n=1 Tax=Corchorus olitorius TaxID=93759 RepID=A0A1R3JT26_9ROSI|nr:hypothetical protein COLO4_14203 [Corchorus olitorius]
MKKLKEAKVLEEENDSEVKKSKKKRKASEVQLEEEERSETSSELVEPVKEKSKKKKAKVEEEEGEEEGKSEDPNAISKFRISEPLREKLKSKGIESLFPIQAMTFDIILDGSDLVGRARTGQGKTLAFVLPILESITNGLAKATRKTGYGRAPSVLVLLPTRELAKQVFDDFEVYGESLGMTSCCLYGGAPYHTQEMKLKRGVDIVVGTPGRIKDHIERGNINLGSLKFRVLDEADEMLRMGFVDDVELILGKVEDANKVQTLLFSATLPDWVKGISTRFLKTSKKTVDLVGNEKMKASTNVRHIVLPCSKAARSQLIPDIIRCYSSGGRTIIFTETKDSASELAGLLPGSRALHGDIQQGQREVTLNGFRSGKFMTLVATNVAARGLDINDVQLIIQCEPPRDVEAYIHRSGRTGRAGNTGVAVMLYDPKRSNISKIEKESGVKFEHISAPQPVDIAKSAGAEAAKNILEVSDSVIPAFTTVAQELLETSGVSAVDLLAKALAQIAGYTEIKSRSLLTSMENYVTLLLDAGKPIYTFSFVFGVLNRFLPEEKAQSVQGMTLTADGRGAVFDVPEEDVQTFLAGAENAANVSLEVLKKELPPLQERDLRGKLVINTLRNSFTSSPVLQDSSSVISRPLSGSSILSANRAKFSGFSSFSSLSQRLGISNKYQYYNPFSNGAKRFYYVDRRQVYHFRPRGSQKWLSNPKNTLIVVLIGSGVFITVYFGNLETVPYTKRKHFVLLSKDLEKRLGESEFNQIIDANKGKVLPPIHPDSVRVRSIAKDIVESLKRGFSHDQVWSDLAYVSQDISLGRESAHPHDTMTALSGEGDLEVKWSREDEILDDKWIQQNRKKNQQRGNTSHLDGVNWEVVVINDPMINAFCLPGGKIVVFTGLLKHFTTDAEIATIIGHEFVMPDLVNTMSSLLLRLPFSRNIRVSQFDLKQGLVALGEFNFLMEIEADYIGLLLMASAGYDPRVAPKVFEKLGKVGKDSALNDYLSTHPSGRRRAQLLSQAQVMEEALMIYREAIAGRGVEGFL